MDIFVGKGSRLIWIWCTLWVLFGCTPLTILDEYSLITGPPFVLKGKAYFHFVPTVVNQTTNVATLDFNNIAPKPIRRAKVQAVYIGNSVVVAESATLDDGSFSITVPKPYPVVVQVLSQMETSSSRADSTSSSQCLGAQWDIKVVDNTDSYRTYSIQTTTVYRTKNENIALTATSTSKGEEFDKRSGAPFHILDVISDELDLVCEANPSTKFGSLTIGWSKENTPTSPFDPTNGDIESSSFLYENKQPRIYLVGKNGVDADEYDLHIIAHEFGHYLESKLFRSDAISTYHYAEDVLDPRSAWSEGFGYAVAAIAMNDPWDTDTYWESGLRSGRATDISVPPPQNNHSIYSEQGVQYFLWQLIDLEKRKDRFFKVMTDGHKNTKAFSTLLSFASAYKEAYGSVSPSLSTVWTTKLSQPYDALCVGACSDPATDTADTWDTDNDLGKSYAGSNLKFGIPGATYPAEFWSLYKPISFTGTFTPSAHDQIVKSGIIREGKQEEIIQTIGVNRFYYFQGNAKNSSQSTKTIITVSPPTGSTCKNAISDIEVYKSGEQLNTTSESGASNNCPKKSVMTEKGVDYVVVIKGDVETTGNDISAYSIKIE
mgnify:CR=1 FL=1